MHTVGGYMVYTAVTFQYVFDYHPDDVFWCTADIGWVPLLFSSMCLLGFLVVVVVVVVVAPACDRFASRPRTSDVISFSFSFSFL